MNGLKRCSNIFVLFLFWLSLLAPFTVSVANAQEGPSPQEVEQKNKFIANTFHCDVKPGFERYITYRATECVNQILKNISDTAFVKIVMKLNRAVFALLTLSVAFLGIKIVLGGVRNMKGETLAMISKLVVVGFFALSIDGYGTGENGMELANDLVRGMSQDLVDLTTTSISAAPADNKKKCQDGNIWQRVDCNILDFIGKQTTNERGPRDLDCNGRIEGPEEQNAPIEDITLFEIGLSQLFTPHGLFILLLIGAATIMVVICFATALYVYILSLIALTFLMMLGPIFIPLFLFQQTKQKFMIWLSMVMGYVIQPAMLVTFLAFLLASLNVAIHGDPVSNSPGLIQSLEKLQGKMDENQCTRKLMVWQQNAIKGRENDVPIPDIGATTRNFQQEVNAVTVPVAPVSYKDLSVFMVHLIACSVLLYVMMGMLNNIGDFVGQLAGGVGGNLTKLASGIQQAGGAVRDAVSSVSR